EPRRRVPRARGPRPPRARDRRRARARDPGKGARRRDRVRARGGRLRRAGRAVNERATVRKTRMPAGSSPDSSETGLAREVIAAWCRRDLDWLIEHSAPDVELRPTMWTGDAFRGREGLKVFVRDFLPNYERLRIDVERVRRAADPVALDVHLRAHLRESDADLDDRAT